MKKPSCETCMYYEPFRPNSSANGKCRLNAPSIAVDRIGIWPVVLQEDWCGQWRDAMPVKDPSYYRDPTVLGDA